MDYFVLGILESRSFGASLRFETQAMSLFLCAKEALRCDRIYFFANLFAELKRNIYLCTELGI